MSKPLIPKGYILLSRSLTESGIMEKPPEYMKVWIYLLMKATHKKNGNLQRGQGFTSIPELQEMLSYKAGYRKVTPTKRQVWLILEWLRNPYEGITKVTTKVTPSDPMIETTKVTHGLLYNIVKYDVYQCPDNYESYTEENEKSDMDVTTKILRTSRQGNNINKNDKNDNLIIYTEIIDHLNQKAGTRYKPTTVATTKYINARLKDGFTVEDFIKVIDNKTEVWINDPKMSDYLRPQTLFGEKFESYLNSVSKITHHEHPDEFLNLGEGEDGLLFESRS